MKGYLEIDMPKACLGLGIEEEDCPYKSRCPVYASLFADNSKLFEEWEHLVCEGRPPACPIQKTPRTLKRVDAVMMVARAVMVGALCAWLLFLSRIILADRRFLYMSVYALALLLASVALMAVVSLIYRDTGEADNDLDNKNEKGV